jgi:hypothetical protein
MERSHSGGVDVDKEETQLINPANSSGGCLDEDLRCFLSYFTSQIVQVRGVQPKEGLSEWCAGFR